VTSLAELQVKLDRIADGIEDPRVVKAAGLAAKDAASEVAANVAGPDRRLSGWGKRGVPVGAGFDLEGPGLVALNLRPLGVWKVLEDGRRASGTITPARRGRGKKATTGKALSTPWGPRASVKGSEIRNPKRAVTRVIKDASDAAPKAAHAEIGRMLREVF